MYSSVRNYHGVPTLFIEDTPIPGFAYITYRTCNSTQKVYTVIRICITQQIHPNTDQN